MKSEWFSMRAGLAAALVAVALASGCAKQNTDDVTGDDESDIRAFPDFPSAQAAAQLTQVTCFSDQDCNPGVAMIAAAWSVPKAGVSVCTSFLVAPDILATNSHCLPSDLDQAGADCSQRLWVFFPQMSGFTEERGECDTVISSTGHSKKTPQQDIAFIRLKSPSARPALTLSRDGFPDKSKVRLIKVNPAEGEGGGYDVGTMQTVECESEQHSTRLPTFDDDHSPVVSLGICEVLKGNSGGPVLDVQGRVVGIIQAFFNPSNVDPNSLLSGPPARLNIATNMACVQSPVDNGSPVSSACGIVPGQDDNQHLQAWQDVVARRMEADSESTFDNALTGSTGVRFRGNSLDLNSPLIPGGEPRTQNDSYVAPIPSCVSSQASIGAGNVSMPLIYYKRGYDEFLVPTYKAMSSSQTPGQLNVTPSGNGYSASLVASDPRGGTVQLFQGMIPACN
jgi:hypothetical protein